MKVNVSVIEYDEGFRAMVDYIVDYELNERIMIEVMGKGYKESEKRFAALFILASIHNVGLEFDYERGEAGKDLKNEFVITGYSGNKYEVNLLDIFYYLTKKTKEELFYMRYAESVGLQWLLEDFVDSGIDSPIRRLD
ncbi:TPA: hypothetical protein L4G10_006545 [Pseudomonas aeruginosa]|nr:hypothetical protein [Pseudomonas aeruginosa]HBO1888405.1 hypothetical protein [Pseudomonas aeruginosa]